MNKPFVFDLHEDELQLLRDWEFPPDAWHWSEKGVPVVMAPGLPPVIVSRLEIVFRADWAERFRVWQVLQDWHPVYFDQLWQEYQASVVETPDCHDPEEQ